MIRVDWLPLLRTLTESAPTWGLWKEVGGDVDSVCAGSEWPSVKEAFRGWAAEHAGGPVVFCTHFPGLLIAAALREADLLQLDVYGRHTLRGATLVGAAELLPLMERDSDGVRRLRPGAEGLLALLRAAKRGGRAPDEATRAPAVGGVERDPDGAEALAAVVGLDHSAVDALAGGGWDTRAVLALELRLVAKLLREPAELRASIARDYRRLRGCSLVRTLEHGRRVEGDVSAWLRRVAATHVVEPTP